VTIPVDRRSFMCFLGSIVPVDKLAFFHASIPSWSGMTSSQSPSPAMKTYVCPPCGLGCDKLTFDKPGDSRSFQQRRRCEDHSVGLG
jgi:hypothetical protein